MRPKYLSLTEGEFDNKLEQLYNKLESCDLCGQDCKVNRAKGQKGKCKSGLKMKISSFTPHFGEEPCLVGKKGSGTIFLFYCSLTCVYCQNWRISQKGRGQEKSPEEVADMMVNLQHRGCHNINWVTPTHYAPQLVKALKIAKDKGLEIPIVYNTGGYDLRKTIRLLDGVVDIYMPDMKYGSNETARKYSQAPDYWTINKKAVREMHQQVGDLEINKNGIAKRGLLVRHLVLPNEISDSKKILKFLAEEISKDTYVNIMRQYRPCYRASEYPELNRRIKGGEYNKVVERAKKLGLHRGF